MGSTKAVVPDHGCYLLPPAPPRGIVSNVWNTFGGCKSGGGRGVGGIYLFIFTFFFFFFKNHTCGIQKDSNWSCSCSVYTTGTAAPDPSCICNLCRSLQQHWIHNPLRPGTEPVSSRRLCWVLNPLSHSGNNHYWCLEGKEEILLTILQCSGQHLQRELILCQASVVPKLRNSVLEEFQRSEGKSVWGPR